MLVISSSSPVLLLFLNLDIFGGVTEVGCMMGCVAVVNGLAIKVCFYICLIFLAVVAKCVV